MNSRPHRCAIPSVTEEESAVISCPDEGNAIRVMLETGPDGYVRLQEMAFTEGLGWYVQRSIVIPREALSMLATELRKADCLMPRRATPRLTGGPMKLVPTHADADLQRKGA